jgi:hypothetical protein
MVQKRPAVQKLALTVHITYLAKKSAIGEAMAGPPGQPAGERPLYRQTAFHEPAKHFQVLDYDQGSFSGPDNEIQRAVGPAVWIGQT